MAWTQTDAHNLRRLIYGLDPRNTVARPSAKDTYECLLALAERAGYAFGRPKGHGVSDDERELIRKLVDDLYRVEPVDGPPMRFMNWDYRQVPDLERMARIFAEVSGGAVYLREVDDGSDEIVIAVSRRPLSDAEAFAAWEASR